MKEVTFTRKELYDLAWSEPRVAIINKYQLSDLSFRKICEKMNIPLPKSGHWAKIKLGITVPKTKLPGNYSGEDTVKFLLREVGEDGNVIKSPIEILQSEMEQDPQLSFIVPEELTDPDPLIIQAKKSLMKDEADKYSKGLVSCKRNELSIGVAPENVERALGFMNTFIKLIKARGHSLTIDDFSTSVIINDENINIRFKEKIKIVPSDDTWEKYKPSGILVFKMGNSAREEKEFKDGKTLIEQQLSKILATIELESKLIKEERIRWTKNRQIQEEQAQVKRELEQKQERELLAFKRLIQEANRWAQVGLIRKYINDMEALAHKKGTVSDDIKANIEWAKKKADWYDPTINSVDELLKEVDKDTLTFKRRYY